MLDDYQTAYSLTVKAIDFYIDTAIGNDTIILSHYREKIIATITSIDLNHSENYFHGYAPDNDSAGEDELLEDGVVIRLIALDVSLPIDENTPVQDIFNHFIALVQYSEHCFFTVFEEKGKTKTQITYEFIF